MSIFFNAPLVKDGPTCVQLCSNQASKGTPVQLTIFSNRTVRICYINNENRVIKQASACCVLGQTGTLIDIMGIVDGNLVRWELHCERFNSISNFNMIRDFLPEKSRKEITSINDLLIGTEDALELERKFDLINLCTYTDVCTNADVIEGENNTSDNEIVQLAAESFRKELHKARETLIAGIHNILVDGMEADAAMRDQRQQKSNEWLLLKEKIDRVISSDELQCSSIPIKSARFSIEMPADYDLLNHIQETQDEILDEFITVINGEESEESSAQ